LASVTFDRVSKLFGDGTRAVSDLSLSVADSEFMVLVGPSGCGKTTALRIVAGLEELSDGQIRIGADVVNDLGSRQRDVAMVFQNYALYPHMDVFENIAFGLRSRHVPKAEVRRRVEEIARVLGLKELLKRKPVQLSGGQRQRVAMGRAIVREPRAFLMDEPLSNLDAKLRVQMRAEISRIQHELGATTIYVTHDQVEAMTMGDRVAVLRRGELQQCDEPQHVYDRPANLFVASFIGSPAMNLVQAEIARENGGIVCRLAEQEVRLPEECVAVHRELESYVGRAVALGVRPEHTREPNGDAGIRLQGRVVLTEALGSALLVHADVPGRPVTSDEVFEAAAAEEPLGERDEVVFVASFEPGAPVHAGATVELALDERRLHFFDLETGRALYDEARVPEPVRS
jgi:multiple sugar transport system ATP-binding protein